MAYTNNTVVLCVERYCAENHDSFGNLHFVAVAIGLNVAIKGAAFFRDWITNISKKMAVSKLGPGLASVLDMADDQNPEQFVLKKQIEETIADAHAFSQKLFKFFSFISWTLTAYGVLVMYVGLSHYSNFIIFLPWPIYVAIIWGVTKYKCRTALNKLLIWQEIHQKFLSSKYLIEDIAKLKSGLPPGKK